MKHRTTATRCIAKPSKKFPSVIRIFLAPNYLDVHRNRGAVLKYQNKNITVR
ncbi:hypothetical protein BDN72DRAFT_907184 [Pluteus cervinus]|uniref:Uncharacterized protein n=1 Tax=Pluteus cervinus TaxID=181527 RepID=A0ACD2ZY07_9AGAR|nr:hypothetical protein BDN72DRAFT_907184 [Pluteus cervinus]